MNQIKGFNPVGFLNLLHLGDQDVGRLHPKSSAKKVISRTKATREWTTPSGFHGSVAAILDVWIEVKSRRRQRIEIFDDRRVRSSYNFCPSTEGHAIY